MINLYFQSDKFYLEKFINLYKFQHKLYHPLTVVTLYTVGSNKQTLIKIYSERKAH